MPVVYREPWPSTSAPHDLADCRSLDGPRWISEGEEQPAVRTLRAGVLEILGHRSADLPRQRQHPLAAALRGALAVLSRPPVQVVKVEGGNLAGAQTQTGQQREDRPITILRRTRRGRTLQQPCELLRGEVRGQAGMPGTRHGRDSAVEAARSNTAPGKKSQERARSARGSRAAMPRLVCGLLPDELGHPLDG